LVKELLATQWLEAPRWDDTLKALESIKVGKSLDEKNIDG
jgi:hypothetical protein